MNRNRFIVDLIALFVFAAAFAAFFILVGRAQGAPPRHATPAAASQRSQLHYAAIGCFHVAPLQWVCPLPAPKRSQMCQGPQGKTAAACGGYPAPPVCTTSINNAYWFGHFWAVYANGSIVYQQGTFRCTGDYPWMWQTLVSAGINPQATTWREWQIT